MKERERYIQQNRRATVARKQGTKGKTFKTKENKKTPFKVRTLHSLNSRLARCTFQKEWANSSLYSNFVVEPLRGYQILGVVQSIVWFGFSWST